MGRALEVYQGLSELVRVWDYVNPTQGYGSAPLGRVGRGIRTNQGQLVEAGFVTTRKIEPGSVVVSVISWL